jgi:hypothetical protein
MGNSFYYAVQNLSSRLLSKNVTIKIHNYLSFCMGVKLGLLHKLRIQIKGLLNQDDEENVWT